MILFLHSKRIDGAEVLINWQKISYVKQLEGEVEITMDNKEKIIITNSFGEFRKVLIEHELTLDENSRIIAPNDDGGWDMVDY